MVGSCLHAFALHCCSKLGLTCSSILLRLVIQYLHLDLSQNVSIRPFSTNSMGAAAETAKTEEAQVTEDEGNKILGISIEPLNQCLENTELSEKDQWDAVRNWATAATPVPFAKAWKAYAFNHTSQKVSVASLACVGILYQGCLDTKESKDLTASPFFPLLVPASLEVLRRKPDPSTNKIQDCIMYMVEQEILPLILSADDLSLMQDPASLNDKRLKNEIYTALQKWSTVYHDENYVSPMLPIGNPLQVHRLPPVTKTIEMSADSLDLPSLASVKPPLTRPLPPPLPPMGKYDAAFEADETMLPDLHAEMIWLTPHSNLRLMLLPEEPDNAALLEETKMLLQTAALERALAPAEQRRVLDYFHDNPVRVESGDIPALIEHNPMVAYPVILRVMEGQMDPLADDYLASMIGMDLSLHTMEVVNRLAMADALHAEYLQMFLGSCMAHCSTMKTNSVRLVRLVCILIQSLIRHNKIEKEDISFEVQTFCVEFSRVREAAALYKSFQDG